MENDEYDNKSDQIRHLASLPFEKLTDHLSETHPNIDQVAPGIAPHIHATAIRAVQFLNSKLPGMGNELMQDQLLRPSEAQRRYWLDLHETVNNPLSILEKANLGTMGKQHLDAVQTVYPALHQEMVNKMTENLGAMKMKGERLPYEKRLMVSQFIGQPLDSTMTVQSMQAIRQAASVNTGEHAQANDRAKASGPEITQINKVNKIYATKAQQGQLPK